MSTTQHRIRVSSAGVLIFLFVFGFATNIPPHLDFYGNSYWGVNADLLHAVKEKGLRNTIVFVRGNYSRGFVGNEPFLNQDVIYVSDHDSGNRLMMERYPGHQYFLAIGNDLEPISPKTYEADAGAGEPEHSTSGAPQERGLRLSR